MNVLAIVQMYECTGCNVPMYECTGYGTNV